MPNAKISELPVLQKLGNIGAAPSASRNWDFAYTWNSGGTTFTADFQNITDTASAAASLVLDRQVGGVSQLKVTKAGVTTIGNNVTFTPLSGTFYIGSSPSATFGTWNTARLNGVAAAVIGWTASTDGGAALDTGQARNAAGVVEVNNGTKGNVRYLMGGGTAVASAAALPLPTGSVFHVTGTTTITSITSTNFQSGVVITLIFDGILTVTDGGNLKLAGNFVTTADDTLTLAYDGTNWHEVCRSVN